LTTLSKNVVFNLAGQAIALAVGFVAVRFIFRQLGSDVFGIIYFNVTLAAVLTTVLELGVLATTVREISRHFDTEPEYITSLIRTASLLYWTMGVIIVVAVFVGAPLLVEKWINLTSIDVGTAATLLRILSVGTMVALPRGLYTSLFRGRQRMVINNSIDVVTLIVQQFGVVVLLKLGSGPFVVAGWMSASVLAAVAVYIAIAGRMFGWRALVPQFDGAVVRRNLRFTTMMMSNSLLATVLSLVDKLVVSKLLAVSEFGLYGFASATVGRATLVTTAVGQAALPSFSSLFKQEDHQALVRQYHKLQDLVCFGTLPMFAAICFGAIPAYTYLFNLGIAHRLLLPTTFLALGYYMSAAVYTAYTVSVAMGRPQIIVRANVLALFIVVPVTVLLIFAYGITGAAFSLVFYQAFSFAYVVPRICRQCLQINPLAWYFHYFKAFGLGVVAYGATWLVIWQTGSYSLLALAFAYLVGSAVFALGAYFLIGADTRATMMRTIEGVIRIRSSQPIATLIVAGTGVALGAMVGVLSSVHSSLAAAGMVVAVMVTAAIFVWVLGWAVGPVVLLIATTLIVRYTFPLARLDIRPEQVAALLAAAVLVVDRLRRRDFAWLRPTSVELLLAAWFVIGLVSSVLEAPSRADSFKVLALFVVSSLAMVLPPRLVGRDRKALDQVVRWLLLAVAAESLYAVLAYLLHLLGPTLSLSVNLATGHLNGFGTLWEPNVLGAVAGAGALAWTFLGKQHFARPWMGIAVCLLACAISFTRAAWLAVIFVFILTLILPVRKRVDFRQIWAAGAIMVVAIPVLFVIDKVGTGKFTTGTFSNAVTNGTDVLGRLYQFRTSFSDLKHSPILGGGIDSYGQRHILAGAPEHLANLELSVVNDTGVLGLLVFVAFMVALVVVAWRHRGDLTVLGLSAMLLVLAITNQATETLELMITWLLIGLLLAAVRVAQSEVSPPVNAHTARGSGS